MSQIVRGSYKAAVTVWHISKPSGIGSRERFAQRLRLADQNSSPGKFYEEMYLLFILKTYQLTYCQKFSNLTTQAVHSSEYDRTGGQLPRIITA